jgi:aspartate aminotransferase-like enzyme
MAMGFIIYTASIKKTPIKTRRRQKRISEKKSQEWTKEKEKEKKKTLRIGEMARYARPNRVLACSHPT